MKGVSILYTQIIYLCPTPFITYIYMDSVRSTLSIIIIYKIVHTPKTDYHYVMGIEDDDDVVHTQNNNLF